MKKRKRENQNKRTQIPDNIILKIIELRDAT